MYAADADEQKQNDALITAIRQADGSAVVQLIKDSASLDTAKDANGVSARCLAAQLFNSSNKELNQHIRGMDLSKLSKEQCEKSIESANRYLNELTYKLVASGQRSTTGISDFGIVEDFTGSNANRLEMSKCYWRFFMTNRRAKISDIVWHAKPFVAPRSWGPDPYLTEKGFRLVEK